MAARKKPAPTRTQDPEGTRQVLSMAFVVLTPAWQDLGVLDEDECFTERGVWGLPRALHRSWSHDS